MGPWDALSAVLRAQGVYFPFFQGIHLKVGAGMRVLVKKNYSDIKKKITPCLQNYPKLGVFDGGSGDKGQLGKRWE